MKSACKHFRKKLTRQLEKQLPLEITLDEELHPESCKKCYQFAQECLVLHDKLQDGESESAHKFDNNLSREKVWQEISSREDKVRENFQRVLTPLVIAAVLVIMVTMGIYWHEQNSQVSEAQDSIQIEEMLTDELLVSSITNEDVYLIIDEELSGEIIDYFIERSNYSMVKDVYVPKEQWDAIVTDLAQVEF